MSTRRIHPGLRLRSTVCSTEVIVVRGSGEVAIECGGAPMVTLDQPVTSEGGSVQGETGSRAGKRYVHDERGVEVLCTCGGAGALAVAGEPMSAKDATKLPSSD